MNHDEAHALIEGLVRDEVAWEPDAPAEEITEALIAELRDMHSTDTLSDDDIFTVLSFLVLRALSTPTAPLELFFSRRAEEPPDGPGMIREPPSDGI